MGKDLYQHLETIYKDQAKYCVVFVSEAYINKNWTKHELRQAQARSFASDRQYILPLRVDDAVLPGLPPTIGYLDLRNTTLEQVAVLLLEKLERLPGDLGEEVVRANWQGEFVEYNGTQVASFWPTIIEQAQHHSMYLVSRPQRRIRWGDEKGLWPNRVLKKKTISARSGFRGNRHGGGVRVLRQVELGASRPWYAL